MSKFQRIQVRVTKEIPHDAADFWAALRNWSDLKTWWPEQHAFRLAKVEIKKNTGAAPITRVVHPDKSDPNAAMLPDSVQETMIHADEEACMLIYQVEDVLGMRNYIACCEVDDLGPKKARVTCYARFDIRAEMPEAPARGMIEHTFDTLVIGGISTMLAKRGK